MSSQRIRLGADVLLDPANERLVIKGTPIALRPKVYGVLSHLVDHPNRIVTKDELLDAIWADTVVGDSVLKVCIRELRAILADDTKAPRFIATVHRRGYRYVGEVEAEVEASRRMTPRAEVRASPARTRQPSIESSLVARRSELEHLGEALAAVADGERRTVFVSGPAGIGKTTLVGEAIRRFSMDPETRVVRGRCQEFFGTKEPYLPFLECVRELTEDCIDVELLRRIAPTWYVQYPWLVEDDDRSSLARELHGTTQSRMLRELDALLCEATADKSVVLVLEDLHWSDIDSLDLLSFLATSETRARILLIAVTRSVELILDQHPLRNIQRQLVLRPRCSELPLELLDAVAVHEIVEQRLGHTKIAAEIAPWIYSRTEGLPLFIVHLLEHLIAVGSLTEHETGWTLTAERSQLMELMPSSLPGILNKSLERYEGDERLVLEGAALAGYEFVVHAVANATDLDVDHVEEICEEIASKQDLLVARGVSELPGGLISARYRFTHSLLRDSLRSAVAPARRVRWERRLAERGEALYGARSAEIATHLANHFDQARLYERAIHYYRIAAANSRRSFSNTVALEHLVAARSLLERLDQDAEDLRRDLDHEIASTLRASGDFERAAETYETIARSAPLPVEEAEAWLLAAGARSWLGRTDCLANVERALTLVESVGDSATRAHAHGCAAYWKLLWDGWDPDGRGACEAALRSAVESQQADRVVGHRARLAFFLALEGQHDEAVETAATAHEEAIALDDSSESLLAQFYGGLALLLGARLDEARDHTTRARDEAVLNGHVPWGVLFDIQLAWIAVEAGDPSARGMGEASAGDAAPLGHGFIAGFANCVMGLAAVADGDESEARIRFVQAMATPYLMDWLCRLIAWTGLARLGDEEARVNLREASERMGASRFVAWGEESATPRVSGPRE